MGVPAHGQNAAVVGGQGAEGAQCVELVVLGVVVLGVVLLGAEALHLPDLPQVEEQRELARHGAQGQEGAADLGQ